MGWPVYSIEDNDRRIHLARGHLRVFGVHDIVTLIQGDSAVQLGRLPQPLDTVFIDGDHTYAGVARDVDALRGNVATGGVLVFHDYYHPANDTGEAGVRRVVDEADESWEHRGQLGAIALFEQLGQPWVRDTDSY